MERLRTGCLIIVLAIVGAAACNSRVVDITKETAAVRARSKACSTAEAAKDIAGALAFWAEDAIVQPSGAPQIKGREAVAALYRQFFEGSPLKEFTGTTSQIIVSRAGDLAFEYGVNRMVYQSPKGDLLDMGKYLTVWKKRGDNWYIAALSITSDAPSPVPLTPGK
jgi:uncharacterized protein (TIGR02246 family)